MRPITFLSDYGYEDEFAGVCRAVIARIAPDVRVIDLTHGIPRHGLRQGSAVLANALPHTPPGIHLAVVDPGVGTDRRGVAVLVGADERILVGPDNGLLSPAIDRLGGALEAVDITLSAFRLEPVSATFHGRDLFAPVAARLASGATLAEAGEEIDPGSLIVLAPRVPRIEPDRVIAHVIYVDRFGNLALDLSHEHLSEAPLRLGEPVEVEAGGARSDAVFGHTFAAVEPDRMLLYEDSSRHLALAVNRGSAAEALGLGPGDELVLRPG